MKITYVHTGLGKLPKYGGGEVGVNCMYADGLGILMQNSIQVPILKANYVE